MPRHPSRGPDEEASSDGPADRISTGASERDDDGRPTPWTLVGVLALVLLGGGVAPSPLERHPEFDPVGPDTLLHFVGHAAFAAALADALASGPLDGRRAAVLAVGVSAGYADLIGRLQTRVPGRAHERGDVVAALVGSAVGVATWHRDAGDDGS